MNGISHFQVTYIRGKRAQGRRKAVNVRYEPRLWNQYDAVLQRSARTNNASEGWHNRFQTVVGRHHPSFYAFLKELQKEQGDTETMLREIGLGHKVKRPISVRRRLTENSIFNLVSSYDTYVAENNILQYLKAIGYNLNL